MKKIDLGQAVSILANAGVIAGIVFLALELQQNNDLLESQVRATRTLMRQDYFRDLFTDPELTGLIVKASNNRELTEEEALRLYWLNTSVLTAWWTVYDEYSKGLIEEESLDLAQWRATFQERLPRMPETWESQKIGRPDDFIEFMERNVVNYPPTDAVTLNSGGGN